YNPTTVPYGFLRQLDATGPSLGLQPIHVPVRNAAEIDGAIATFAREPGGGMIVVPDIFNVANRVLIIESAAKYNVPAIYTNVLHTRSNGLISYGPDTPDLFRRSASYVDRILKGEKPADLPVQQPTKYELIVNLKTAKAFGLTIPRTLLTIADEVI